MAVSRQDALTTLADGHRILDGLLARLSEEQLIRRRTIGGGDWSARDLVVHLAYWEELAVAALADWRADRVPEVENTFSVGAAAVDRMNAANDSASADQTLDEVRARAAAAHAAVVDAITEMADQEWTSRAPYSTERRRTLGELMGSVMGASKRPFGHAFAHLEDLRAYVDQVDAAGG
jgi:hypothetical protein